MLSPNRFPSLRYSLFAGEAFTTAMASAWQQAAPNSIVENLYGPTEATVTCLHQRYHPEQQGSVQRDFVPIGQPNPDMHAAIIDDQQHFLPAGEKGELVIAGPQVVAGYWQLPAISAEKFIALPHPALGTQRWYRTGDFCMQDSQGVFYYLGRIDNQCKVHGHRVELEEVEYYLRKVTDTVQVAALLLPAKNSFGHVLCAVVCTQTIAPKQIREKLADYLPHYMLPDRIEVLDALPYTLHGKLDRQALAQLLRAC